MTLLKRKWWLYQSALLYVWFDSQYNFMVCRGNLFFFGSFNQTALRSSTHSAIHRNVHSVRKLFIAHFRSALIGRGFDSLWHIGVHQVLTLLLLKVFLSKSLTSFGFLQPTKDNNLSQHQTQFMAPLHTEHLRCFGLRPPQRRLPHCLANLFYFLPLDTGQRTSMP